MKASKDYETDASTLPELLAERNDLLPKLEDNSATVRQVRRFVMIHSLISLFDNAKIACRQIRKNGGNLGQQVKQELIQSAKKVETAKRMPKVEFTNPVIRDGLPEFQSEDINNI